MNVFWERVPSCSKGVSVSDWRSFSAAPMASCRGWWVFHLCFFASDSEGLSSTEWDFCTSLSIFLLVPVCTDNGPLHSKGWMLQSNRRLLSILLSRRLILLKWIYQHHQFILPVMIFVFALIIWLWTDFLISYAMQHNMDYAFQRQNSNAMIEMWDL